MPVTRPKQGVWEFGPFRLDEAERLLTRDGQPVGLTPKVFDTLVVLVEQSGHLVEKDALMDKLWPDTIVEEGSLTRNISDLRKALGEERYVETVAKRGYRFVAPVTRVTDERTTLVVEKTTEARLVIEEELEDTNRRGHPARRNREVVYLLIPGVCALLLLGGSWVWRAYRSGTFATSRGALQTMEMNRFTASGNIVSAAISPDGKYVATALDEDGLQSLQVRQVSPNTSSIRVIPPAQVEYLGLTFSSDSNFIYYVSLIRNETSAELYQLPLLGGTARRLLVPNIDTPISFSPSGDRFAYVASSSARGESWVKVSDVDGGAIETLMKRSKPGFFTAYPGGPAWSPDGEFIACAGSGSSSGQHQTVSVFVANIADKSERQLTAQVWFDIGRIAWLGDASGLVVSAQDEKDGPHQLWFVAWPDGSSRRITNDLLDYQSVSLSRDGRSLMAVQTQATFSIVVTPHNEKALAGRPDENKIFSEVGNNGRGSIAWTPDHRLIYSSRASGNWDVWSMNKDGTDQKQLTLDPHSDLFPAVSRDGRYIYFASDRAGSFNIWRIENVADSRVEPARLTSSRHQFFPEVTPDGQWIVYQEGPGYGLDDPSIWKVPATGGEPERLAEGLGYQPAISPDGKLLAWVYLDERGWGVALRSFDDNETPRKFPFPSTVGARLFRWTPDGQSLAWTITARGASNIWLQRVTGGPPTQLTSFKSPQLSSFSWSHDGKLLACVLQSSTSDAVLLRNFK